MDNYAACQGYGGNLAQLIKTKDPFTQDSNSFAVSVYITRPLFKERIQLHNEIKIFRIGKKATVRLSIVNDRVRGKRAE